MTATAEVGPEAAQNRSAPGYARRRKAFGGHVAAVVERLQEEYIKRHSGAVATLAQLRAAACGLPGGSYPVLQVTEVPARYLEANPGDEPTDTEYAKHTVLTVYAWHQQSIRDTAMHRDGTGLGTAIAQLGHKAESPEAVRRRFAALGTAISYEETVRHLLAMVRQLRDKRIALDYGLLADDLFALRRPGGRERVQALWGRDFYRTAHDDNPESNATDIPSGE
jgi:CRISPR system Cascade subunit CasB